MGKLGSVVAGARRRVCSSTRDSRMSPYMALSRKRDITLTNFYTKYAQIGAQEKMALACIYEC